MEQLAKLKILLGNPTESDDFLNLLLDNAKTIICDLRNSDVVEPKYLDIQVQMAIELYNKRGAEGQTSHSENGISRTYDTADAISNALLSKVTPIATTPFSITRVVSEL